MEKVCIHGQTVVFIKVRGKTTESKVTENTFGVMDDHTRDIGRTIKCTDTVFMCGRMVGSMKEITFTTKNKVTVSTTGPMENDFRDVGSTESVKDWARS
jgi:hypothetical protein